MRDFNEVNDKEVTTKPAIDASKEKLVSWKNLAASHIPGIYIQEKNLSFNKSYFTNNFKRFLNKIHIINLLT